MTHEMNVLCTRAADMSGPLVESMARYRHRVFVERLRWTLPLAQPGLELDQFDLPSTVHLVARTAAGELSGYGRLLPTSGPHMLEHLFGHLVDHDLPVPRGDGVWELSRFAALAPAADGCGRERRAERLLLAALQFCRQQGASQLVAVTTTSVERLILRTGIECRRLGAARRDGARALVAIVMAVSDHSIGALERNTARGPALQPVIRHANPVH